MLFFPTKYPEGDWQPADLQFEDVFFASEDGTQLHGWYCPAQSPQATVLIAHGNAGHVASRADWLICLQSRLRVSTFMFDYRGYGRSRGLPTVRRVLEDARAARRKLSEMLSLEDSEIALMGESLGGGCCGTARGRIVSESTNYSELVFIPARSREIALPLAFLPCATIKA